MLSDKIAGFTERDFFNDRMSREELKEVLQICPVEDLFSWKSPSFKALGLEPQSIDEDTLVSLMLEEPRLIRRPFLRVGNQIVIGSDISSWLLSSGEKMP